MTAKKWPETWQEIGIGNVVFEPGSSRSYLTGNWRAQRPIWDNDKCIKCGICYLFCPEGCISKTDNGYYAADMDYCKGCGICAYECPPDAISMITEEV